MLSALRWIIGGTLLLLLLGVCSATALFLYTLEPAPLVPSSVPADHATVADGKALLKRLKAQVESAGVEGATLAVSEAELDDLAQIGSHALSWVDADAEVNDTRIVGRLSVRLPENPFGSYLNLSAQVQPNSEGIAVDRFSIGPLSYSGRWLLPVAARLMDALLRDAQASELLEGVNGVQIANDAVLLSLSPPPDVKEHLKQAVRTLQAYRIPAGEEERVTYYYDLLVGESALSGGRQQSLSEYLAPLMIEAARRSARGSAVTENRAALWALVIYFSNGTFEALAGKLVSSQRELVFAPYDVTLASRRDLRAHFIASAGMTLASQQGISFAVGEFKELLDSGYGGSGFSFVDLAADRAGIHLVSLATASEEDARQVQSLLSTNNTELAFFPDTAGLIEGLSDAQFRQQYGDVKSAMYLEVVETIDRRIAGLLIYRDSGIPIISG